MLKALRKKGTAKKILWALAIVIIPAFVLWGGGSILRERTGPNYAGKIFGKKISWDEYKDALSATRIQAIIQLGDDFYKVEKKLNLQAQAWDRLILFYEARKRKIQVEDREVVRALENFPFFQSDGKFNQKLYSNILDYVFGISARTFEEQTRDSLMIARLYNQETYNVNITEDELLKEYGEENEAVKVDYLFFSPNEFNKDIAIEDNELSTYFKENSFIFRKPPAINIEYIGLDYPPDSKDSDKNLILTKINEVAKSLKKEVDFNKIARDFSLTVKETGLFSQQESIVGIGWSEEFLKTAFNLELGQISLPLETTKGCYVLKLKEKRESYIPSFEEAKEEVKKKLIEIKSIELAKNKANQIRDSLKELSSTNLNIDFSETVKSLGINLKSTDLFKRNAYIPEIGFFKNFQDTAFGLKEGQISEVISTPQGFYILKLKEFVGMDKEKFTKEKEEFRKKILEAKRNKVFGQFLDGLLKKADLENNIKDLSSTIK